jgi:hypothetical protein
MIRHPLLEFGMVMAVWTRDWGCPHPIDRCGIITVARKSLQNTIFKELAYQNLRSKGVRSGFMAGCARVVRDGSTAFAGAMMERI